MRWVLCCVWGQRLKHGLLPEARRHGSVIIIDGPGERGIRKNEFSVPVGGGLRCEPKVVERGGRLGRCLVGRLRWCFLQDVLRWALVRPLRELFLDFLLET